jgi:hypothetical protein
MAWIGRNDSCPCGSGKKYKKCCLDNPAPAQPPKSVQVQPKYQMMRAVHWSLDEIRTFSTEQIIQKLRAFGVAFEQDKFLQDVRRFRAASDLADYWHVAHRITARGFDEDFIWMAAIVLWERLAPEVMNSERLDDLMQAGYDLLGAKREAEACRLWLQVWEHLKARFRPEMKSIDEAEKVFSGLQSLSNWCYDLEMELGNAGRDDRSFYAKRIQFCHEFYNLFPATDANTLLNMKHAEAESLFALGQVGEGEKAFAALIEEFPDSAWGYIGWGDMYCIFRPDERVPLDFDKAEHVYRLGLARATEDHEFIVERLADLEKERIKQTPAS